MRSSINFVLVCLSLVLGHAQAIEPIPVEYLWQSDPKLDIQWDLPVEIPNIHINVNQLSSTYISERMRAAQAILRVPDSRTINRAELLTATVARLESGEPDPSVRAELVAAGCELDDGQHAGLFWRIGNGDRAIQPIVESACVRWKQSQPLDAWRLRLKDRQLSPSELLLAINGIGAVGGPSDVDALKEIALDETQPGTVRLTAARAIGTLATASQLELAEQLKKSHAPYPELLAVSVLASSPAENVTAFVQEIVQRSSPIAERAAYEWLCARDPQVAQATATALINHIDSHVRSLAVDQITALNSRETLPALIGVLDDAHPALREQARLRILDYCKRSPEQLEEVQQQLAQVLKHESWRPVEQTIRLSVELKRPEHVPQLLALLDHARPEVCITAGWALRHLATDQASLKAIFDHLTVWVDRLTDPKVENFAESDRRRMAHLFEIMGLHRYEAAGPMLLQFVPKDPNKGLITRMTAIWACGRIWENGENKELTDELELRIADKTSMFPESPSVRFMCTLALGWVADPSTREALVRWNEPEPSAIFHATEWALKRIDDREKANAK